MQWSEWTNLILRWIHVIAGITWIGHLYFFNWVNGHVAKTYDADSKKKVVPELMPRALYWFRWGAAWTWLTGVLLLGIVIYMGGALINPDRGQSIGVASGVGLGALVVGWVIYDLMWKGMAKKEPAGVVVALLLLAGMAFALSQVMSGRAVFIHVGAILGTNMASNVWFRIWPAQRKIIAAIRDGNAPDAALAGLAGLRSKQNTYMSVPLVLLMVSNHFPTLYGADLGWVWAVVVVAVGLLLTKLLFKKSASPVTAQY